MLGDILGLYVINILYFVRISEVDSVFWGERVRRMLKFEFGC